MSFGEQMRYVVLPQSIRIATPPTVGFMVQLIKNTSLASIIGFIELTYAAQINNPTLKPILIYGTVGALYFAVCFPLYLLPPRALEVRFRVAIIDIESLHKRFGAATVLDGIDLTVAAARSSRSSASGRARARCCAVSTASRPSTGARRGGRDGAAGDGCASCVDRWA